CGSSPSRLAFHHARASSKFGWTAYHRSRGWNWTRLLQSS
ncbi:unnamed protein product, partial [Ectocarpus fasciculatus]